MASNGKYRSAFFAPPLAGVPDGNAGECGGGAPSKELGMYRPIEPLTDAPAKLPNETHEAESANSRHSNLDSSQPGEFRSPSQCADNEPDANPLGILAGIDLTPIEPALGNDCILHCALIWCPEVPAGTQFTLVRRNESGETEKLEGGMLDDAAPSLNLARLRQRGAQLGANEVVLILPQGYAPIA